MKNKISLAAVAATLLIASSAYAAEVPSIVVTALSSSNATTTSALIGSAVHASVQLATASTTLSRPAGTVDISTYPNTTCTGTSVTQNGLVLTDGGAISAATNMTASGMSFKAHYNGQADVFTTIDSPCVAVTPTASAVTLSQQLSSTSVATGTVVRSIATISGATAAATGTMAYNVYSDSACSTLYTSAGTRTVSNASTTFSNDVAFGSSGSYYWRSVYSGDQSNAGATSACALLTVTSTVVTPPATTTAGTGTITGVVFNDLNRSRARDTGEVGIPNVKINLFKGNGWWRFGGPVATVITDANGQYTFTGLADGTYSVEEVVPTGWKQISSDFRGLVLSGGVGIGGKDFANVEKVKKDKEKEKEEKHENRQDRQIEKFQKQIQKFQEKINKLRGKHRD